MIQRKIWPHVLAEICLLGTTLYFAYLSHLQAVYIERLQTILKIFVGGPSQ